MKRIASGIYHAPIVRKADNNPGTLKVVRREGVGGWYWLLEVEMGGGIVSTTGGEDIVGTKAEAERLGRSFAETCVYDATYGWVATPTAPVAEPVAEVTEEAAPDAPTCSLCDDSILHSLTECDAPATYPVAPKPEPTHKNNVVLSRIHNTLYPSGYEQARNAFLISGPEAAAKEAAKIMFLPDDEWKFTFYFMTGRATDGEHAQAIKAFSGSEVVIANPSELPAAASAVYGSPFRVRMAQGRGRGIEDACRRETLPEAAKALSELRARLPAVSLYMVDCRNVIVSGSAIEAALNAPKGDAAP